MNAKDIEKLEREDQWNFDAGEHRPPVRHPRMVVSVSFGSKEFALVSSFAERTGKRVSQFIREAAVEKAADSNNAAEVYGSTAFASSWTGQRSLTLTDSRGTPCDPIEPDEALTY